MFGILHGLKTNFTVKKDTALHYGSLSGVWTYSEVITQRFFFWVHFRLLTEDAPESCVRGPEQPALNEGTRIMVA